jgi:hypothetical protein
MSGDVQFHHCADRNFSMQTWPQVARGIMISDISNLLDSGKFVEHILDSDDIELSGMDKNSYTNFTEQRVIIC